MTRSCSRMREHWANRACFCDNVSSAVASNAEHETAPQAAVGRESVSARAGEQVGTHASCPFPPCPARVNSLTGNGRRNGNVRGRNLVDGETARAAQSAEECGSSRGEFTQLDRNGAPRARARDSLGDRAFDGARRASRAGGRTRQWAMCGRGAAAALAQRKRERARRQ